MPRHTIRRGRSLNRNNRFRRTRRKNGRAKSLELRRKNNNSEEIGAGGFGIVSRPRYDLKESEFVKCCEKANILTITQGYVVDNNIEYPVVFIQDDIRKLNEFIEKIKSDSY